MQKLELAEVIKSVKQPNFDNEMITRLINGLYEKSFYNYIQRQNRVENSGELDRQAEQDLWQKKAPGEQQQDSFRHMGYLGDIDYCISRLYINCNKSDLMTLANLFTEKCSVQKFPIYFKYSTNNQSKRADQMVIYSNIDNLSDYIQILQEIAQEHPDIIERCGEPPLLTGKINEWIGIGDEPAMSGTSYSEVRANIIENVLSRCVPRTMDDKDEIESFDIENTDFDLIREELRKAFEERGISIDTFAFNKENLELYMSDSQTRMSYSQERKQQRKDNKKAEQDYSTEQFAIQELKILKQMGVMPETIDTMIAATSKRNGVIADLTKKKVNTSNMLQTKFSLPEYTLVTDNHRIQIRKTEGIFDISDETKQKLAELIEGDLTEYYTKYFAQEQSILDKTLSRYSELVEIPSGQSGDIDIERADLSSKLILLAKGKNFFRTIGIPEDSLELVCNRIQNFLQEIEQKREEEQHPEMEARRKFTDRDYLHAIFLDTGITDPVELRRLYEEQNEIRVDEDDLESVLEMFSDNVGITPSQIEEASRNVGIGINDINETTKGIRDDLTQDKQTDKIEDTAK